MTITPVELAHRVRITPSLAAMFLGYWLKAGVVEEVAPGDYRLTPKGRELGIGLLDLDTEPLGEAA